MTIVNNKYNQGKPPVGDLVKDHPSAFEQLAYILKFSTIKYGIATGFFYIPGAFEDAQNKIYNSLLRHMVEPFSPDEETGQSHIALAITELVMHRECAIRHASNGAYVDQVKAFYGEEKYRQMNEEAMKVKDLVIWAQKWEETKANLREHPHQIPVAEVLLRSPQTIYNMSHAMAEYKASGLSMTAEDKFKAAGWIIERDPEHKIFAGQQANSYDMAAYLLLSVTQEKLPDPKIFLN